MRAFTDYPFTFLGDIVGEEVPIRECTVLSYDGDKYCDIMVGDIGEEVETEVKAGYLYKVSGRSGEVSCLSLEDLTRLPRQIIIGE